jgi:HD superfamily phosphohydrolase
MFSPKEKNIIQKLHKRKCISISRGGAEAEIDITGVLPIVNHPYFQKLEKRRQLSNVHLIFPDAMHTRFNHSLDVMLRQQERSQFWLARGMISRDDARRLEIYALLHDIGHGPFSHILDRVCSINHDQKGAQKIEAMRHDIEKCGVSFERIQSLFEEKNPLYKAVMHHPLGTDKLSYLYTDACHCITARPDIGKIAKYIFWLDNQLMVHIKCAMQAMELKRFYVMMYREVYLRKSCIIGQRILEKLICYLLRCGDIDEDALWELTDDELTALIKRNSKTREGYIRYQKRQSKCVFAIKLSGFGKTENISGKSLAVYEKDKKFFDGLIRRSSNTELCEKEDELAKILKIGAIHLDIVPPIGLYRFTPPAITLLNGAEIIKDAEIFPENEAAIAEFAKASTVLRVCVSAELRDKIYKQRDLIDEFFDDWAKQSK